jgi:probable HAF family extracellular repeat protein
VAAGETDVSGTIAMTTYTYIALDDPLAPDSTFVRGINNLGQIVGYSNERGFLYSNGSYTTLSDPLAAIYTEANGINNTGEIVGQIDSLQGFLYSGGTYTHLAISDSTQALGINDSGVIVGTYDQPG